MTAMVTDARLRGIVLMVLSMAAFALADMLVKLSTATLPPAQTLIVLMVGGLVVFVLVAVAKGETVLDRRALAPVLLLRYAAEAAGMIGMVMALTHVPLSTVGAVTQASPILATLGAVVFLGETISWRRWSAIAAGFAGVLLVIQPGAAGFDLSVLWAVLAMAGLSARDMLTRLAPPGMATTSLAACTMVGVMPFVLVWLVISGDPVIPGQLDWMIVVPMVGCGAAGYLWLIASLRVAPLSVVTPFRYTRTIFLLGLGVAVFGERPGVSVLVGAALIVVAGVYMLWREQRVTRQRQGSG